MRQVRMRTFVVASATALVVAAVAATGASALPEFGACERSPTHEGRYTDSNCLSKAKKVNDKLTGEFEWHKSTTFPPVPIKGQGRVHNGGGKVIEQKAPLTLSAQFIECAPSGERLAKCREGESEERLPVDVECEGVFQINGEFSKKSDKELTEVNIEYYECQALGSVCANTDNGGGEPLIQTDNLKGVLGYIKKASPKEVGLDWKPESGNEVAKFTCGGAMSIVLGGARRTETPFYPPTGGGGGAIAAVTPINEMGNDIKQVLTVNAETDENTPSSFEGKPIQALEGYFTNPESAGKGSKWSPVGETLTSELGLCGNCDNGENMTEIRA